MSDDPKAATGGNRRQSAASAKTHAAICRPVPPFSLPSISHPPDFSTQVVTDQQRSVGKDQQADRAAPALAVRALPPDDEILHAHRAVSTAVDLDAHDLGPCRYGAIPRAVESDERVAAILAREL